MPTLVVEKGSDKGKSITVPVAGTVIVGRDTSTALPLRDTMTSRMHFKIEAREDGFWVDDLGSMNGTYLNGAKLRQPVQLDYGDLIKAGETLFTFHADESAASTATLTGQKVGGYRILARIGRGGMGTVYKAEQVDLQRLVALKVISDEHTKDKDFVELFIHEARAAAKLNHPNVVQVYDVKRHGESYYFSMEYVSGGSVQEVLNRQRRIAVDEAVAMILDAARGLEYAHKKGIVHRDVKPDNFMISETGTIKIGDMGLARGLDEKVGPEEETSVIGTPHYIAPEQVLGQQADFRSDVYSLGATFYRMLTGVTPFSAPSVRDLVNRKVREEAPPAHEHAPEVPKGLSTIVSRMMARDPARRYQSMGEVIASLEKFQQGQTDTAELRSATGPIGLAGNRRLIAAAGVAALLLVALGAFLFRGNGGGPMEPPVPKGHDLQLAAQMLENAKLFERQRMDRNDVRAIDKAMQEYEEVVEKFPGSPYALKAAEYREALSKHRREVAADRNVAALEQAEEAAHRKAADSLKAGRADFAPVDEALRAYEAFAAGDAAAGTPGADRAKSNAARARRWRTHVSGLKDRLDQAVTAGAAQRAQGKFREAQAALLEIREEARRLEADPALGKGRYAELIVDDLASREAEKLASEARAAWMKVETDARVMASDGGYEGAIRLVDGAAADSVEEIAPLAKVFRESLEQEWAMVTRRLLEERAEQEAKALAKAREEFETQSRAARALALKYDFAGALAKIKVLRDANGAEELKARLDRRVVELERCAHLKDSLVNVIKARGNPYRIRKELDLTGIQATIEDADERGLQLALGPGGTTTHGWTQFTPSGLYDFVRNHWKYSVVQRKDGGEQCDVVAFLMEFGLYEEAAAEIEQILRESAASAPEAVRKFCEDYKARLEKGEAAEHGEVEAEKRLGRLEGFMKRGDLAAAKSELDLLKGRYGKTRAVQAAGADLEKHRERIEKEGGESLRKSMSEDRHRALMVRVQEEQSAAKRALADTILRLQKLDDPFERNVHLGAVHAAAGDFRTSAERYSDARRVGEQMVERKLVGPEFLPSLGAVYAELLRNAVLQKDRKSVESIRNLGSRRFVNPETKLEEKWWTDVVEYLSAWSETVLPQEERKLPRLRDDVKNAPDDPQRVWALAQCLSEGLAQGAEARGLYAWLLENHPDFPQVQNGNVLFRYAELLYGARELGPAVKRYQELQNLHREHPKVADPAGVRRRLDDCIRLLNRLGTPKDRK